MLREEETEVEIQRESVIVAPNLLERNFTSAAPNEKWITNIAYIQYGSSTLYLSTIMDLYNNEIVAYKLYDHQQTLLVIDTLNEALGNCGAIPKGSSPTPIKEVSIRRMPIRI